MVYNRIQIHINNSIDTFRRISELLNLEPIEDTSEAKNENEFGLWIHEVKVNENEPYFDFINSFLNILEPNFEGLTKLGVQNSDISFWYLYEYENQCSMEFRPDDMKRLGDNNITLCISCWESNKAL